MYRKSDVLITIDGRRHSLIAGIIFLIFALIFYTITSQFLEKELQIYNDCIEVTRGYISNQVVSYSDGEESVYNEYTYFVDNQKYVKKSNSGLSNNKDNIGDKVEIHYNPVNPSICYAKQELKSIQMANFVCKFFIYLLFALGIINILKNILKFLGLQHLLYLYFLIKKINKRRGIFSSSFFFLFSIYSSYAYLFLSFFYLFPSIYFFILLSLNHFSFLFLLQKNEKKKRRRETSLLLNLYYNYYVLSSIRNIWEYIIIQDTINFK